MKQASIFTRNARKADPYFATIVRYCRDKSVLDLGVVQHNLEQVEADGWLHRKILDTARHCVGVDYLEAEVQVLRDRGYNIIAGDVTKPLPIDETFDVIVAGNLIEHLDNFAGFFENLNRLLDSDGRILIVTPNPFYREQYFYTANKNEIIVNPEHTCWLDPVTLNQLAGRHGFTTERVHWLDFNWSLGYLLSGGREEHFDILTQRWQSKTSLGVPRILAQKLMVLLFSRLRPAKWAEFKSRYSSQAEEILYHEIVGRVIDTAGKPVRWFVPESPVNRWAVFLSVLRKENT